MVGVLLGSSLPVLPLPDSQPLAPPIPASAPLRHIRHSNASAGASRMSPHTSAHPTQNSCVQAEARASHSRSSSSRTLQESPIKIAPPRSNAITSSGGAMVTYSAQDESFKRVLVMYHSATPVNADMMITPMVSGPTRNRAR